MIAFAPLGAVFGLQAEGVDLSRTLPDADFTELAAGFYRGGVLVMRHHYGNRDDLDRQSRTGASVLTDEQEARLRRVRHPLVRVLR